MTFKEFKQAIESDGVFYAALYSSMAGVSIAQCQLWLLQYKLEQKKDSKKA